ncbi:MAG TPA: DUF4402 domain-containing protein [Sphingomicrobium sp.]
MCQRALTGFTAMMVSFAAFAAAAPAHAANNVAQVSASVAKPLILMSIQSLDLGTIALGPGTWSNATMGISRTGVFSCANANITCSGATRVATYNVSGTNNRVVLISAPNVTLVNQSDPTKTLTLVVDALTSVTLTNSGPPGTDFSLGGSITLSSTTESGTYSGTFNVTVDYQ